MGRIKLKSLLLIGCFFIIIISFFNIFSEKLKAEEQKGVYIVGEPTYTLTNTIIRNEKVIGKTYQINITLYNSLDTQSEELTVNLTDRDGSLNRNTILAAQETQTITFTWSTIYIKNQKLSVNFYPANLDGQWTEYNTGSRSFTLIMEDTSGIKATNTPGFELIIFISALIILIFINKKR